MFTLWYSVLSFKEYRNSTCSVNACAKSNDVRPSSPKPIKPSTPVQIPSKPNPNPNPNPVPVPVPVPVSVPVSAPAPVPKPLIKPTTPPSPAPATVTARVPPPTSRFQQLEQQQENRARGYQSQVSPLTTRKPDATSATSAQFIKRENSYSSEEEEEADEDDEDEDSEIERIDLHHK